MASDKYEKRIKTVLKVIIFWLLAAAMILAAGRVTEKKDSRQKYNGFTANADKIDVLFLGSSHMLYAVNPVQLYQEYGITAYNMGRHGCMTTESYWMLVNALDYCQPKCVVVDLWALDRNYHYDDVMDGKQSEADLRNNISLLHEMTDFLPGFSLNKVRMIRDLIKDPQTRQEFYWNFMLYHSRWDHLIRDDYLPVEEQEGTNRYLGAGSWHEMSLNESAYHYDVYDEKLPEQTVCTEYLHRIIALCRSRNIGVILTFMPMAEYYEQDIQAVNTAADIAAAEGIPFINMLYAGESDEVLAALPPGDEANAAGTDNDVAGSSHDSLEQSGPCRNLIVRPAHIVDLHTDLTDGSHLNSFGMRKVTAYIGKFLNENYGAAKILEDHRGEPGYEAFERCLQRWQSDWISRLTWEEDLYMELGEIEMLGATAVVYIPGGSPALYDPQVVRLLKQISGTDLPETAAEQGGPYLLLQDYSRDYGEGRKWFELAGPAVIEHFDSIFGDTMYIGQQNFGALYQEGDLENNILDMEEHYYDDVQILILGQGGEIMARLYYNVGWTNAE
ncbi:MAG: hypothetical protein IJV14_03650 [Lachnospiraceae bacterium]|nr:hypothetical protein [Lachnospiraceae bacterium]